MDILLYSASFSNKYQTGDSPRGNYYPDGRETTPDFEK